MPIERRGTHSNACSMETLPTLRGGITAIPGVERIAQRARQQPETCFSTLMHHFSSFMDNKERLFNNDVGTIEVRTDQLR